MATLEELRRQNQKLRNKKAAREEIARIGRERARLMKENRQLKNPKRTAFFKGARKFGANVSATAKYTAAQYQAAQKRKQPAQKKAPVRRRRKRRKTTTRRRTTRRRR